MAYTQAEIDAALVSSVRTWRFRYERLRGDTVLNTGLDVVDCKVQCSYMATGSNRTCNVTFGPNVEFNQLSDLFRPWADLLMPDGGYQSWSLGLFRLSGSTLRVATTPSDRPQKLDGYDLLLDCQDSKLLDRKVIPVTDGYTGAALNVLTEVMPTPDWSMVIGS